MTRRAEKRRRQRHTSGLVAQIQGGCIVGFAVDSAHGGEEVVVMRGRIPLAPEGIWGIALLG